MNRHIKTALWGIFLFSTMASSLSAQQFHPQLQQGFSPSLGLAVFNDSMPVQGAQIQASGTEIQAQPYTDMRYRGNPGLTQPPTTPVTDAMYRGPFNGIPATGGPAIPGRDFLRGNVGPNGSMGSNIPGYNPTHGGFPNNQHQLQSINGIPRSFNTPKPIDMTLLHHSERHNIVGGTYNDGRGGSARGNIGMVGEANLGLVGERDFAGVRGGVRGGLGAQGHIEQQYDINGMPIRNYSSGEVFLGTEAHAHAGLSPEGLGAGVGGFSGLRAQATSGIDMGPVDVAGTVEGRIGFGADANANIGLQDGRFRIKGEVGAALGIGGKVGVDTEVDLGDTGRFIENTGNGAIRTVKNTGHDVDKWGQQAGRDIKRTTNKVGNDVKNTANKVGGGIKKFGKSIFGK